MRGSGFEVIKILLEGYIQLLEFGFLDSMFACVAFGVEGIEQFLFLISRRSCKELLRAGV